jgi:phage terminase small subunit
MPDDEKNLPAKKWTQKSVLDPDKPLTPAEQLFVDHYCGNGFNATDAHEAAGFPAKNHNSHKSRGSALCAKINVRKAILLRRREMQVKIQEKTEMDREWVLRELQDVVRVAKQVEAVKSDGKTVVKYQPQAAVRALELIGKEVAGMFVERTADVTDSVREREKQLSLVKRALEILEKGTPQSTQVKPKEEPNEPKTEPIPESPESSG